MRFDSWILTGINTMPDFQVVSAGRELGKCRLPGASYAEKSYLDCRG